MTSLENESTILRHLPCLKIVYHKSHHYLAKYLLNSFHHVAYITGKPHQSGKRQILFQCKFSIVRVRKLGKVSKFSSITVLDVICAIYQRVLLGIQIAKME